MKRQESDPCRVCGIRPRVVTVTDGFGNATYPLQPCKHEVRIAALRCIDCNQPHGGNRLRWRCEACKEANRRAGQVERNRKYNRSAKRKAASKRYRSKPEKRAKLAAIKRQWYANLPPEHKQRLLEAQSRRTSRISSPKYWKRKQYEKAYREKNREMIAARQAAYRERLRQQDKAA